jgi:hypothetical protein
MKGRQGMAYVAIAAAVMMAGTASELARRATVGRRLQRSMLRAADDEQVS